MSAQLSFFDSEPLTLVDDSTGTIRYYPTVVDYEQATKLFSFLIQEAPWTNETMWMYDHEVEVPRLVARYSSDEPLPEGLAVAKATVEKVLGERFTSVSLNYYRNERDSVAWHSDHIEELVELPTIALLSLGATRRMQVRTKQRPRRTYGVDLEPGSLFVMSGHAQEFWEHTIAKSPRPSDARISVAFRPRRPQV